MAQLLYGNQYITTALSQAGGINDSTTTDIVLASTASLDTTKPGMALLNYADPLDTSKAEWVEYTTINSSTKTLEGVTRGSEGFSAKSHDNSVAIAFPLSESHINRMAAKLDGNDALTNDLLIAPGKNIQYNAADPSRTIWAGSFKPTTTAGCAASATVEAATSDIDYDVLDFDKATDEHAFINWQMPASWGGGTLLFRAIWTCTGSGAGETVTFALKGRAYADDDAIDQAAGTAVSVADTVITDGDIHISAWSTAVTLAGTPAGGQFVHLDIMRDISEDDLAVDARLIGISVKFIQTVFGD